MRGRNKREKAVSVSPVARTRSKMTPKGFPTHNEAAKLKCGTSLTRRHWLFPEEITCVDKAAPLGELSRTEGKQIRTLLPAAAQKSSQHSETKHRDLSPKPEISLTIWRKILKVENLH